MENIHVPLGDYNQTLIKSNIFSELCCGLGSRYPFFSLSMKVSSMSTPGYGFAPVMQK